MPLPPAARNPSMRPFRKSPRLSRFINSFSLRDSEPLRSRRPSGRKPAMKTRPFSAPLQTGGPVPSPRIRHGDTEGPLPGIPKNEYNPPGCIEAHTAKSLRSLFRKFTAPKQNLHYRQLPEQLSASPDNARFCSPPPRLPFGFAFGEIRTPYFSYVIAVLSFSTPRRS